MNRRMLSVIVTVIGIAAFTAAIALLSHNPTETPYVYIESEAEPEPVYEPALEIEPTPEPESEPELEPEPEPEPEPEIEVVEEIDFEPIFTREPLPDHIIAQIEGVTFHETTPFDHSFLTYLTVTHVNFYGESTIGHLIVADEIGDEVLEIFEEIFEYGFPIYSIRLIDYFDASDYYSMAANNSHAFNFRYIAGTNIISRHGFGMAIDINPIQNPYIRGNTIWPAAGAYYLDREYVRPGMIVPGSVVYYAFIGRGWIWGGNWTSPRDYHHFERR
ncbi:MAG: M15 family metallopeptidase [Defluviitaleaceae bacterium]|nr:M15 family metallopeptidase [Defluviitaleaceae bacterium]